MKHVVSISLGSTTRDHRVTAELLGEEFLIERIGMNGDYDKYLETVKALDGKVDAIGMGGISLYLPVKNRRYIIKSALPLMGAAKLTPVVDGAFLREALEPRALYYLRDNNLLDFEGKRVLMTCAVDRYALSKTFVELGSHITCGDLIFTIGIPFVVRSLPGLDRLAFFLAPTVTKLPFDMLYPTGQREEKVENPTKFAKYYEEAHIISGDFNFIKRYMPDDLSGKVVITNTITKENIEELRVRGISMLVSTTPEFDTRSFGSNVIEAIMVALYKKPAAQISRDEYIEMADRLEFFPRVIKF